MVTTQLAFIVQSQQKKHLKKVWNMFQVKQEKHQNNVTGVFIITFEHISHLFLMFLLLTLNN